VEQEVLVVPLVRVSHQELLQLLASEVPEVRVQPHTEEVLLDASPEQHK
jgi:hypothetical protein